MFEGLVILELVTPVQVIVTAPVDGVWADDA